MDRTIKDKRHDRIRKKVSGTSERPRLSVYKSLNHIYAQIIDDAKGVTIAAASSLDKEFKEHSGHRGNAKMAGLVGELIGKRAKDKGISKVVFDRSGYMYHGGVKMLADAARQAGIEF